jgi:hypothetical protein
MRTEVERIERSLLEFHRLAAAFEIPLSAAGDDKLRPALLAYISFTDLISHGCLHDVRVTNSRVLNRPSTEGPITRWV